MARKLRPNTLMPPDAGEDDGWAKLLAEMDAQTPPQIETAVLIRIAAKLRDMITAHIPQQLKIAKIGLGGRRSAATMESRAGKAPG